MGPSGIKIPLELWTAAWIAVWTVAFWSREGSSEVRERASSIPSVTAVTRFVMQSRLVKSDCSLGMGGRDWVWTGTEGVGTWTV